MHFPRPELAAHIAASLAGRDWFGDAHNGLFLAGPRRTGKSTFLQADLLPALAEAGAVAVYVDLWADAQRDAGALIGDAISRAIAERQNPVGRAARAMGLQSVTVANVVKLDTSRLGTVEGTTLVDLLRALHQLAQAPVALIVDEAQHALTSLAGEAAMSALKSARDQMNRPGSVQLMLVMTGSDRDKLLRLVHGNSAPFYGSQVSKMPLLGAAFMDQVAELIVAQRPVLAPIDAAMLLRSFEVFGCRPQFFLQALGQALSPVSGVQDRFEAAVLAAAEQQQRDDEAQILAEFLALRPLERAVLWRMLDQGQRFRPYDAEALRFYRSQVTGPVTPARVQAALESLRARSPALVWKSARGEYAVDDAAMHRWFAEQVAAGRWPPIGAAR